MTMARVGGRNAWLAVPIGLICAAIVAALVWLAAPMTPILSQWGGDMLREASTAEPVPSEQPSPTELAAEEGDFDCRAMYPDSLWAVMAWQAGALLSQTTAAPASEATALTDALQPVVRVTCDWRWHEGHTVVSTLSRVGEDAVAIAEASLEGEGFTCAEVDAGVNCTRTSGDVRETQTVRDGWWLSSVESAWHPEAYGARLSAFVWGEAEPAE
ncbi:hypothetical protein [Microbacterium marmarense]|uniref:Uncharacterized protein n=1 Tax=Microbacterium marmarense TaxID=3122051 RepID=A0ABU8LWC9_9MICO